MSEYADTAIAQFENVNSMRAYPFMEQPVSRDGKPLPLDAIVDLRMTAPSDGAAMVAVLSSMHLSRSMLSACFRISWNGGNCALSVNVSTESFKPYMPYRLEPLAGSAGCGGVVTFGDVTLPDRPETYFFDGAPVVPCCVSGVRPAGLRRIIDPRSGESLSGDVTMDLLAYATAAVRDGKLEITLNDGASSALMSGCSTPSDVGPCGATPISSINGVRPDQDGNIVLWFH